jgi:hypothetical protein
MGTKTIIKSGNNSDIIVRRLDLQSFETMKKDWDTLLGQSSADPLFLSWEWQYNWWKTFGMELGLELFLLGAYNKDDRLIGLAPCFKTVIKIGNLLKIKRIQFIGNCYNGPPTVRTEYLNFIVLDDMKQPVFIALFKYIENYGDWDEFVAQDLDTDSYIFDLISNKKVLPNAHRRIVKKLISYQVNTQQDFQKYLSTLGKNTRKHLYNRRKHLSTLGNIELRQATISDLDEFFKTLNMLHRVRWGKDVFSGNRLSFHRILSNHLIKSNQVIFNILTLDGRPLAARINYRVNNREYAIQSGINDKFDKKLSLGILLTGYMIENTIADGIKTYDFLAGGGKTEDYKHYMSTGTRSLMTVQLIRKWHMKILYQINDYFH